MHVIQSCLLRKIDTVQGSISPNSSVESIKMPANIFVEIDDLIS